MQRRDFTINGLLLDPPRENGLESLLRRERTTADPSTGVAGFSTSCFAQDDKTVGRQAALRSAVLDCVGGLADLDAGVIRAIGRPEQRFEEDHLRMLRAVRFAARFGFDLEAETKRAISSLASRIHTVSRERVRDELTRMLTEGRARPAFELLDETGLLREVLPEVRAHEGRRAAPAVSSRGRRVGRIRLCFSSNWSRDAR